MGFQPVPNTASVEFVYWNGKSYAENVLHYKRPVAWTLFDMQTFAAQLRAWYVAEVKPIAPATLFLSKIIIKDLTTQFGTAIEYTAGMPLPGDNGSPMAPMNVTAAVKLVTGLRGRSYRGRVYVVGLTKTSVEGDVLTGDAVANWKGIYESLLAEKIEAGDPGWCVVSRWENLVPRVEGLATPIVSIEVEPTVDSQRRRLLGRGA